MPEALSRERATRLRRGEDFRRILRRGRKLDGPLFTARVLPNESGCWRLGLAVSRRLGGAVRRNRARRLLRECFRLERRRWRGAHDIVLIAKGDLLGCGLQQLRDEFERRFGFAAGMGRTRPDGRR